MERSQTADRVQLHSHVPVRVRDELAAVAQRNDRSLAAEIRRALAEHVQREQKTERGTG